MTEEQEIRSEALEQATRLWCKFGSVSKDKNQTDDEKLLIMIHNVQEISEVFAEYIREGQQGVVAE